MFLERDTLAVTQHVICKVRSNLSYSSELEV